MRPVDPDDPNVAQVANNAPDAAPPAGDPGSALLGPMPSGPPGVMMTPDGWQLNVTGLEESLAAVPSLTGAPTSREYIVDGTFVGTITGAGSTELSGGVLEAGYQIGCGIIQDTVESITSAGVSPFVGGFMKGWRPQLPTFGIAANVNQQLKIALKPGTVNIVSVGKKSYKGDTARVSIYGFRVKIDGCAGQSFIRSFATLTSSTDDTDDVITYLGVTKAV
ncbi:MspA family porin [Mycolicibacterium brumae]|uniref:MspA protein n=1 Tax=Mycolicibacterium brumae TaxID=85968 RepID=A0A2G5PIE4_9MYCO|nr:MspA family porin [Mycolicibacterium brumae]PIB77744.1 MspA protein [Mycolicibacterium brumae]